MPLSVDGSSSKLLALPPEILDQIFSYIDRLPDLTAFALASRQCARHVIPRHTEYRIVRANMLRSKLWHHLAERPNLTRNIREVHMYDKYGHVFPDRYPTTLVPPVVNVREETPDAEAKRMLAMCSALWSMDVLTTFIWTAEIVTRRPPKDPRWEVAILDVISRKAATLRHLLLKGEFATANIREDPQSLRYPVWRITNLTSLHLSGANWFNQNNASHLECLLSRNPNLENLVIPMEFTRLAFCSLPRLKRFKLTLTSGAPILIDRIHIQFLAQHPTIEELEWYPIGNEMDLPSGILPNLKYLSTNAAFVEALYSDGISESSSTDAPEPQTDAHAPKRRAIECLNLPSLAPSTMQVLERTPHDRASLRKLVLYWLRYDDPIDRIPQLFPNITHLNFPSSVTNPNVNEQYIFTMDGWLKTLPQFQRLEVFRGTGIWETVRQGSLRALNAIESIARACPNLREIDDVKYDPEAARSMRIVISREWIYENGSENWRQEGFSAAGDAAGVVNENDGEIGGNADSSNSLIQTGLGTQGGDQIMGEDVAKSRTGSEAKKIERFSFTRKRPKQTSEFDIFLGTFD
ncbi:hypothetical protein AX17_007238 [Amanita inopinata Kibby_2008]|nr:hypothetical protein AX17_007238 [Amanita inopinata Kibby_2008]